jgi:hypothetical protein
MTDRSMDARDLNKLAIRIGFREFSASPKCEEELDAAALALRRAWFERAHKPADTTLKSPCVGTTARLPGGDTVSFGYERDLDISMLEDRGVLDHPTPDGWTSSRVVCRSGQSTLSCLLHLVTSMDAPTVPLTLHHADAILRPRPWWTCGPDTSSITCRPRPHSALGAMVPRSHLPAALHSRDIRLQCGAR